MTNPKKVSDFAKEYQKIYIANGQLTSVLAIYKTRISEAVAYCKAHPDSELSKKVRELLYLAT